MAKVNNDKGNMKGDTKVYNGRTKNRNRGKPTRNDSYKKSPVKEKDVANDVRWYLKNGAMTESVGRFSFNNALGDRIVFNPSLGPGAAGTNRSGTIHLPGIAAIYTVPCCGRAIDEVDPVNVAAVDIYSFVRHANSGHANYDPADLMLYFMTMDSIYTFWSWMTRIYGVCKTYSQVNRYIGDALITACGADPDDIRANLAQFNTYINQFAVQASVLAVPGDMTLFARHSWMYQNVYMDEDNAKAQLYLYAPAALHKYTLDDESKGMLQAFPVCQGMSDDRTIFTGIPRKNTFAQIMAMGDELLNAALSQEDVGIMSGDVRKAYGPEKLWRFAQLPLDYAISPIYSEEVLLQIHNTDYTGLMLGVLEDHEGTLTATVDAGRALSITQRGGIGSSCLHFFPLVGANPTICYTKLLDSWHPDPTPEEVIVASRNKVIGMKLATTFKVGGANIMTCSLQGFGSELCLVNFIWKYDNGQLASYSDYNYTPAVTNRIMAIQQIVSKFNEYPLFYMYDGNLGITDVVGEVTNYTTLDTSEIINLHRTALLSMFNVPTLG